MGRMDDYDPDNMEMPILCQSCGQWTDLNGGTGSDKWYPGTGMWRLRRMRDRTR